MGQCNFTIKAALASIAHGQGTVQKLWLRLNNNTRTIERITVANSAWHIIPKPSAIRTSPAPGGGDISSRISVIWRAIRGSSVMKGSANILRNRVATDPFILNPWADAPVAAGIE